MKLDQDSEFVGIGEAARIMSLSRTSMQKLVDAGEVAAIKTTGGHRRILRSSLPNLLHIVNSTQAQQPHTNGHFRSELNPFKRSTPPKNALVLIVAQELDCIDTIKATFESQLPGIECAEASDGLDVVLKLERMRPDILIIDLHIPMFDGFGLIKQVSSRQEYPEMVIVAISSFSTAELQSRGGLPQNVLLLHKPLNIDRLKGFADAHLQLQRRGVTGLN
jgi:excisionase family DNA binding protein